MIFFCARESESFTKDVIQCSPVIFFLRPVVDEEADEEGRGHSEHWRSYAPESVRHLKWSICTSWMFASTKKKPFLLKWIKLQTSAWGLRTEVLPQSLKLQWRLSAHAETSDTFSSIVGGWKSKIIWHSPILYILRGAFVFHAEVPKSQASTQNWGETHFLSATVTL